MENPTINNVPGPENSSTELKQPKINPILKEILVFVIIIAVVVIPIRFFVIKPFIVSGESMEPNFHESNYLIVDQISYNFLEPQRGEIVIFRLPENKKKHLIKRIIATPGETIRISGSDVFIKEAGSENFVQIDESYLNSDFESFVKELHLGEDEFFVMGDNRTNSTDSRIFGLIKKDYIVGRAWLRLLPITEIGIMPERHHFE